MIFLIDYENVNYVGLEGIEFLRPEDTVKLFYSDCSNKIKKHDMDQIIRSKCQFEIIKLKQSRKNALDFYIATCVGEIFALNRDECVAIISSDAGFKSVRDYWHQRLSHPNQLVVSGTIAKGICSACEANSRKHEIQLEYSKIDLEKAYQEWNEKTIVERTLRMVFESILNPEELSNVCYMAKGYESFKDLYLCSLKQFGKEKSLNVYRKLKPMVIQMKEND